MPRLSRFALAGLPQHVIQRGHNHQNTFVSESDYRYYLDCLKYACDTYGSELHAYVLMPNHVHLLLTPSAPNAVAHVMKSVGQRFVRYVNCRYRRTGTLWEGRYRASLIEPGERVLFCYRYIEMNPVRARIVGDPAEYQWSSFRSHTGICFDQNVVDHPNFVVLADSYTKRTAAYRALFGRDLDETSMAALRIATNQGLAFGCERFKDEVEQFHARGVRRGRVGRPRREMRVGQV